MDFLDTTMFKISWPGSIQIILMELLLIFTAIKYLSQDKSSKREKWLHLLLATSFVGSAIFSEYIFLLIPLFFILGAQNVPFRKLVQIYCIIAGTLMVVTIAGSQLGIVENLIYGNRISLGFNYPTDFAAHIFFFALAYCYLRKDRLTYIELAGILVLSIFTMIFNHARTNSICLFLTFAVFLYLKVRTEVSSRKGTDYKMSPNLSKVLVMSMPICAALIIGLTFLYNYDPGLPFIRTIDKFLTGRLYWGNLGLEQYGIRLFGSTFDMVGAGGATAVKEDYFFLDSSYVLLLIRYGIMVFLSVITVFILSAKRAFAEKDIVLLWILALISIQCTIEQHLLEMAYNPFLYYLFSSNHQGER